MSKYRKKPIVIDAWQWSSSKTQEPYPTWIKDALDRWPDIGGISFASDNSQIHIATLEGIMVAIPNDYIIRGVKGEIYACKPDIFEMTYDCVDTHDRRNEEERPSWLWFAALEFCARHKCESAPLAPSCCEIDKCITNYCVPCAAKIFLAKRPCVIIKEIGPELWSVIPSKDGKFSEYLTNDQGAMILPYNDARKLAEDYARDQGGIPIYTRL